MISFPHAKINLGLSVLSKRSDGFHNLETIFYPLPFRDALEIIPSDYTIFSMSGLPVPGEIRNNLVMKTYEKIKRNYPQTGNLEIYLHKAIPAGAGLGGGSSDAAEMILLINQIFDLHLPPEKLQEFALELGSDCPFFIQRLPCIASGRGEIMEAVSLDLSTYSILLVHPEIHIDTAWAFSKLRPALPEYRLKESIAEPIQNWRNTIRNDFEKPVFEAFPALKRMKDQLYAAGALYASLSGSGSGIFGIFPKSEFEVSISLENGRQTFIR
jgi:4-diphosphocytidyl-2-C-methyl-D-erythritol kinase